MTDIEALARQHLADWRSGWSMGSFGAIAEFHQNADEIAVIDDPATLARATRRGAIRLDRARLRQVTAIAYETLSPRRHRWSQAVAFCLPAVEAKGAQRSVLTEIGPDDLAIRGIDRTGILFDMGLALPQCDFCIRTSEPKLLVALRAALGHSLFEPGNPAMPAILAAHPHRVALTAIGRAEVYQKIGGPDTGGVSPPGPHTHLLPKLLKSGRTHSANTPIPDGLVPLGSLHPGNPVIGPMGDDRPFDAMLHDDFQALLAQYGAADLVSVKRQVQAAIAGGQPPSEFQMPSGRFARAAARLALRQLRHTVTQRGDAALSLAVDDWIAHHETPQADEADDDAPGH